MATSKLCKVCRGWHPLDEDWPAECIDHFPKPSAHRSDLAVPMVIFDSMPAVQSQTNGLYYDSKSAIRSEYKRAGVIELGNERLPAKKQPTAAERKAEIRKSLEKSFAKAGF